MPGDHFMILGHHCTHTILVQYVRLKELHLFSGKDQIISQCTCTLTIPASIPASTSNMDKLSLGSNPIAREIIKLQTRSKEHFSKSVCHRFLSKFVVIVHINTLTFQDCVFVKFCCQWIHELIVFPGDPHTREKKPWKVKWTQSKSESIDPLCEKVHYILL